MKIQITKTQSGKKISIDGQTVDFWRASRLITGTHWEDGDGIFDTESSTITFQIEEEDNCRSFSVDFGSPFEFDFSHEESMIREVGRRKRLMDAAIEELEGDSFSFTYHDHLVKYDYGSKNLYVDGVEQYTWDASRILTGSTGEAGSGIFNERGIALHFGTFTVHLLSSVLDLHESRNAEAAKDLLVNRLEKIEILKRAIDLCGAHMISVEGEQKQLVYSHDQDRFYVNGEYESFWNISRLLTDTVDESGWGCLDPDETEIEFRKREGTRITVHFDDCFTANEVGLRDFWNVIQKRANKVKEAFSTQGVLSFSISGYKITASPDLSDYTLDGVEASSWDISRKLTDTTNESGLGIFSKRISQTFVRGRLSKTLEFNRNLITLRNDRDQFRNEIVERIKMVKEAFQQDPVVFRSSKGDPITASQHKGVIQFMMRGSNISLSELSEELTGLTHRNSTGIFDSLNSRAIFETENNKRFEFVFPNILSNGVRSEQHFYEYIEAVRLRLNKIKEVVVDLQNVEQFIVSGHSFEMRKGSGSNSSFKVDGDSVRKFRASRILTSTDSETGDGIFSRSAEVNFSRDAQIVKVDFHYGFEYNSRTWSYPTEIKRRIHLVNEAFKQFEAQGLDFTIDGYHIKGPKDTMSLTMDGVRLTGYAISRTLTGTDDESRRGIFTNEGDRFWKDGISQDVDFTNQLSEDMSSEEFRDALRERIYQVKEAFRKKTVTFFL